MCSLKLFMHYEVDVAKFILNFVKIFKFQHIYVSHCFYFATNHDDFNQKDNVVQ